jgi:molecular chaperone GrpE
VSSAAGSGSGQADNNAATDLNLEQALMKLAEAEQRADQARDDLLRVQAEMQNLRRRTQQDVEKAHKFGQEKFSAELLSVIDNLERALAAASAHEDETVKAIYEGVDLTLKSFMDCFSKFHIETVDPMGEPFDPSLHQAMSIQENPDVEPNTVIAVMQKGYTLHGRVLRPAMVMVSKASGGGATGGNVDEQA